MKPPYIAIVMFHLLKGISFSPLVDARIAVETTEDSIDEQKSNKNDHYTTSDLTLGGEGDHSAVLSQLTGGSVLLTTPLPNKEIACCGEMSAEQQEERVLQTRVAKSKGLYAIPYEPGVTVHVTNDHLTHSPKNRIDMSGTSPAGPYKIVAAQSGNIKFIEDSHNVNGGCENNNYVWIAHSNGEWTKYAHIAQNSATVDAGLRVGDTVTVGQFLGIESDIGCASDDHLHFEVAVPDNLRDPIDPVGGYIKGTNRIPRICGIPDNIFVAGTSYKVPGMRPGWNEYARHGLANSAFQADFDAAARCGFRMDWNSGYDNGLDSATFNVVYHANQNPSLSWLSHHILTEDELTAKKSAYEADGFELVYLDVYAVGSDIRYAAIFNKGESVPITASYYGLSATDHQSTFNTWTAAGWYPRVLSVTSVNGERVYAAIYTQQSLGSWQAKSFQTSAQYQTNFDSNSSAGRRLIYLKSYVHSGQRMYSAIWSSTAAPSVYAKHGLTSDGYQTNYDARVGTGWETGAVSATVADGKTRFAAYWEK